MTTSMTDREMLAAMWAWSVRMPSAFQKSRLAPDQTLFGKTRTNGNLDELIAPIVFLQVHGTAAEVRARWEAMRDALIVNRKTPVGKAEGLAVEAALSESMNLLRDTLHPAAAAAEERLHAMGCRYDASRRMAVLATGGRPRTFLRAAAVAVLRPYRRDYLRREGRGPSDCEMREHLLERLSGVFDNIDPRALAKAVENAFEEIVSKQS